MEGSLSLLLPHTPACGCSTAGQPLKTSMACVLLSHRSSHKLFGPRDFYACQLDRLHTFTPQQQDKWKALSAQLGNLKVGRGLIRV